MPKKNIITAPNWVVEHDVLSLLHHDLQLKLAYYESQCRTFQHKYGESLVEFETRMKADRKEDFTRWEDFMDWETADSARQEIQQRLQELAAWKT